MAVVSLKRGKSSIEDEHRSERPVFVSNSINFDVNHKNRYLRPMNYFMWIRPSYNSRRFWYEKCFCKMDPERLSVDWQEAFKGWSIALDLCFVKKICELLNVCCYCAWNFGTVQKQNNTWWLLVLKDLINFVFKNLLKKPLLPFSGIAKGY